MERENCTSKGSKKFIKTLDGKRAGLQTSRALREEKEELRRKEEKAFWKLDKTLTGENAATAIRASGKLQRQIKAKQAKEKAENVQKFKRPTRNGIRG